MRCANPACTTETLYLRSGRIFAVDFASGAGDGRRMERKVIWLCDACTGKFAVETWRPAGEQVRPARSLPEGQRRARRQSASAEAWD